MEKFHDIGVRIWDPDPAFPRSGLSYEVGSGSGQYQTGSCTFTLKVVIFNFFAFLYAVKALKNISIITHRFHHFVLIKRLLCMYCLCYLQKKIKPFKESYLL